MHCCLESPDLGRKGAENHCPANLRSSLKICLSACCQRPALRRSVKLRRSWKAHARASERSGAGTDGWSSGVRGRSEEPRLHTSWGSDKSHVWTGSCGARCQKFFFFFRRDEKLFLAFPRTAARSEVMQAGTGRLSDGEHNRQTWPRYCTASTTTTTATTTTTTTTTTVSKDKNKERTKRKEVVKWRRLNVRHILFWHGWIGGADSASR